jgi:hypothetical protein
LNYLTVAENRSSTDLLTIAMCIPLVIGLGCLVEALLLGLFQKSSLRAFELFFRTSSVFFF